MTRIKPNRSAITPPRKVMTTPMEKRMDKARLPVVAEAPRTVIQKIGMNVLHKVKPIERAKMTTVSLLKDFQSFS